MQHNTNSNFPIFSYIPTVRELLKTKFLIAYTMIKRILKSSPEIIQVRLQVL